MQNKAVFETPADMPAKMEAAEVSDTCACAGQGTSSHTVCHNNNGKTQDTFETFGDVEAEGRSDTVCNVDAETQSKQDGNPKHLQTH